MGTLVSMFIYSRPGIIVLVRRILTFASLICLVALAVLYPVIEGLDRWDGPGPCSDTEIQVIALLTLVGAIFVLARLLVLMALFVLERVLLYLRMSLGTLVEGSLFRWAPLGSSSPPLILRT